MLYTRMCRLLCVPYQTRHHQVEAEYHSNDPPPFLLTALKEDHAPEGVEKSQCQGHESYR